MPGKEVVVAHRLSMDRSATAGAPLPPADDYVFQKAGAAVDRAAPPPFPRLPPNLSGRHAHAIVCALLCIVRALS